MLVLHVETFKTRAMLAPRSVRQKPHGDSLTRFSFCHEKQFIESIPLPGIPTGNLCAMGSASRDFLG